jgi:Zn-dependent protease with chaperone function
VGGMARLTTLCTVIIGAIYGVYEIDRFLKKRQLQKEINSGLQFDNSMSELQKQEMLKDYEKKNQEDYEVNNQFVMVPLFIVLIVIMSWCFYLRFVMAFMKRKRLLWVEVQDYENSEYSITRNVAKQNLHLVGEIT